MWAGSEGEHAWEGRERGRLLPGMQIHQLPIKGGGRPGRGEWTLGLLDESVNGIEKDLRAHFGPRLIGVTKDVHGWVHLHRC